MSPVGAQSLSQSQRTSIGAVSAAGSSQDALRSRLAQTAQLRKSYTLHTAPASEGCYAVAEPPGIPFNAAPSHTPIGAQHLLSPHAADVAVQSYNVTLPCMPQLNAVPDAVQAIDSLYAPPSNVPTAAVAPPPTFGLQLGASQGLSQESSGHAWAASQQAAHTPTLQHSAIGSPVRRINSFQRQSPAIMLSPPKSPPGSFAARAAALSQALQNSQQNLSTQHVQQSDTGGCTGFVRERALSDDVDALFEVLGSPAVQQKIAKVSQEAQTGMTEASVQQQPPGAAQKRVSGSSSDDDALLAALNSPEVQKKLQQSQAASVAAGHEEARILWDLAPAGDGQVERGVLGENGIAAANNPGQYAPKGRTKAGRRRLASQLTEIAAQGAAGDGGESAVDAAVCHPDGSAAVRVGQGGQEQLLPGAMSAASAASAGNGKVPSVASGVGGQAAGEPAAESDDDDIVMVYTQPSQQPQQQAAENAPNQVINLC